MKIDTDKTLAASKIAVRFVARRSVKVVVAATVAQFVPVAETRAQKVQIAVGTYVLSDMVATAASKHVAAEFDDWVDVVKKVKSTVTNQKTDNQ